MAKKDYTVLKAVKMGGEEHGPGDTVSLEQGKAAKLLGLFIEEKPEVEAKKAGGKGSKASDGL